MTCLLAVLAHNWCLGLDVFVKGPSPGCPDTPWKSQEPGWGSPQSSLFPEHLVCVYCIQPGARAGRATTALEGSSSASLGVPGLLSHPSSLLPTCSLGWDSGAGSSQCPWWQSSEAIECLASVPTCSPVPDLPSPSQPQHALCSQQGLRPGSVWHRGSIMPL